jgi:integrase
MAAELVRKFKPPTEGAEYVRYLRKDELEKLFEYLEAMAAHSEGHLYMLVLTKFLFVAGMRIGEVTQLRWEGIEKYNDPELGKQYRVWFIGKMRTTRGSQKVPEVCIELGRRITIGGARSHSI